MSNEAEREAIFQALGEASVCWEHPEGAGVFDASRAAEVGERLIEALARIRDGGPVRNERRRRELAVLEAAERAREIRARYDECAGCGYMRQEHVFRGTGEVVVRTWDSDVSDWRFMRCEGFREARS